MDKKYEKMPKKYSILVSEWCQVSCSVWTDLIWGPTLFWHIFFHSGVELPDGFFVLGGAKVGVDFAGDFYAGVTKDSLGGEFVYAKLKHEGGGSVAEVVGGDRRFVSVHQAYSRAVAEPRALIAAEGHH